MNTKKLLAAAVLATSIRGASPRFGRRHERGAADHIRGATGSVPSRPFSGQIGGPAELASLERANEWLNSPPLTPAALRGKVILIDFWTYTCINWLRTAPYVRAWAEKYKDKGLVVIGVHAPEFGFEKSLANVRWAVEGDAGRATRSLWTMSMRSGEPSRTNTGQRCTSSTRTDGSGTSISARALTSSPR